MPVLKVYGIPEDFDEDSLQLLCGRLQEAVAKVNALNISKDQVSVFFPTDRMKAGLGEEIVVFVDGLFGKPERNRMVRMRVAEAVVATIARIIDKHSTFIECFVRPFNKEDGYCSFCT